MLVKSTQVQCKIQSDIIASHYNYCILSITIGRIVLHYPSHAHSKHLVEANFIKVSYLGLLTM